MALYRRLLNLFHRAELAQAIDDELQFHIDERVDELKGQGLCEPEARRLANRQFGNATLHKERTREMDLSRSVESLLQDIRYALRSLRHTPAFTVAAIATLALGIGATTAIYSVVRTVWLRPLPFTAPDRVVRVWESNRPLGLNAFSASIPNFLSWRERSSSFESLVALEGRSANLTGQGDPERVASMAVTARFFDTLGIRTILGRPFSPDEDRPGLGRVVLISERLWRQRYGGDPDLVGRTIPINGENRTVIGIAPRDVGVASDRDVWEPLTLDVSREIRGDHHVVVLGRLKPGITVSQAEAELNGVASQLEREFPDSNRDWRVRLAPALHWIVDPETRAALLVLMAAVGLLLVVACINVANLLLARASSRVHEFGVRQALGAGRARLLRQLVTESVVLACVGGGSGVFVALLGVEGLRAFLPANVPRGAALSLDFPVLAVAAALTLATGLLFGLAPAWAATRTDVNTSIRQGRRTTAGAGRLRLRPVLVAGEFALATMLVAGAGLLLASLHRLQSVDLGFQPRNVLTARISLPKAKYSRDRAYAFYRDLDLDLNAAAGVQAAGAASNVPFGGGDSSRSIVPLDDSRAAVDRLVQASWRTVTSGYFQALRIPLLRGRLFDERELASGRSILLSESLARRLWLDAGDPIGRLVRVDPAKPPLTVVGVVGDVRQLALNEDPRPTAYLPASWYVWDTMMVAIRGPGEPAQLALALRQAVEKLDPQQPIFAVRTLEDVLGDGSARPRLNTFLVSSFALLALTLGVVGVAGVVSYSVIQRTPEMAVRIALGATPKGVVHSVMAGGLRICLLGLAAGLAGACALGRAMAQLLYQVRPNDPAIFVIVAAVLLGAALLASWLPARKIARIDPVVALRQE